jgi:branched-chain amino acid transport system permease protein
VDAEIVLQYIVTGLLVGGVYALMSMGLALIFGIMRVINFAQGDFLMLGMYFAFFLAVGPRIDPIIAAFAAAPIFLAVGLLLHRFLVSRVTGATRGGQDAQLILTLGLSLILQNLALMLWSPTPRAVRTTYSVSAWEVGPILFNQARTYAFLLAMLLAVATYLFLQRTTVGRSLRAVADDWEAATYMGIDVRRSHAVAFAVGTTLAAMAGSLVATYYPLQPYVAWDFIVIMFVSVVLGGLGSVSGAFVGGLVIGLIQSVAQLVLPLQLQNVAVFVIFLFILYIRPRGLFGRAVRV